MPSRPAFPAPSKVRHPVSRRLPRLGALCLGAALCLAGAAPAAAAAPQGRIYWLEFTGLHAANANGTGAKTLVSLNDGPDGVAVDAAAGKVY